MAYADSKDLPRRTASDKLLQDKAFKIAKNLEYDGYQRWLGSIVYKFFDKKSLTLTGTGISSNSDSEKQQIAKTSHKPIIRKLEKLKVYPFFKGNIWHADLADM